MYSIGEMSRRTGVKIPTIRYYEQVGLIAEPGRSSGNQRRYSSDDLQRLAFIRHARDLGLTLEAIGQLAQLSETPELTCEAAHKIASEHLSATKIRIAQLQKLEVELSRIATKCDAGNIGACYVIQSLVDHDMCETEH